MRLLRVLISIWLATLPGFGSKILAYFPTPAPSHHFFFQSILYALAERGHQIDYYTPVPMRVPHQNVTVIKLELSMDDSLAEIDLHSNWKLSIIQQMQNVWKVSLYVEKAICKSSEVQTLLSSNAKYDLLIHEGMFWLESANIFKHKFNIPSVALLAVDDFSQVTEFSGLVIHPSYMVNAFTATTDRMNFWERLQNTFVQVGILYAAYRHVERLQAMVDECMTYPGWQSRPPLLQLISDQALILVNNHPSVGFPFPRLPHFKEIGGAEILPRKPLPKDLANFMNGAKDGVILFSMGSLFDFKQTAYHNQLKNMLTAIFSERKERILWKWNGEPWENIPANIKLNKWFPQQDILAHENMRLFITHGGLQSLFEAVYFGVPLVTIPSFGDQNKNSLASVQHGYGVRLSLDNITESSLKWALEEVLNDSKYRDRILKGSELLKDRPLDPVDEGVYWVEYILRHGHVLQPEGARLNFIQLHCLDIWAFILISVVSTIVIIRLICNFIASRLH